MTQQFFIKFFILLCFTASSLFAVDSITIDNFNNSGTITVITDIGTLHNVQAIDPATINGADPARYTDGMVYFEVAAPSANVTVLFNSLIPSSATYYKFTSAFPGGEPTLYDFTAHTDILPNGWVLHLNEGGFGDMTGNDNLIVDPGGPRANLHDDENNNSDPGGNGVIAVPLSKGALTLLSLLLLISGSIILQRKETV